MKKILLGMLPRKWRPTVRLWKILSIDMGHANSVFKGRPVDAEGGPLPWYYCAIDYLRHLDFSQCRVFEYGCGNSTRWWSARAKSVVSIEHSQAWAKDIRAVCVGNVTINVRTGENYVRAITERDAPWDVIVIDGEQRDSCASAAPGHLAQGGMVIVDNSDWHSHACRTLRDADLIQIDFHGFGPINGYPWTTSVFLNREFRILHGDNANFGAIKGIKVDVES